MIDPITFDPSTSNGAAVQALMPRLFSCCHQLCAEVPSSESNGRSDFGLFWGADFRDPFGKEMGKNVVAAVRTRYIDRMLTHIEYVHVVVFTPYCTILITCDSHKRTCYYFAWKLLVFDHSGNDYNVLLRGSGYLVTWLYV